MAMQKIWQSIITFSVLLSRLVIFTGVIYVVGLMFISPASYSMIELSLNEYIQNRSASRIKEFYDKGTVLAADVKNHYVDNVVLVNNWSAPREEPGGSSLFYAVNDDAKEAFLKNDHYPVHSWNKHLFLKTSLYSSLGKEDKLFMQSCIRFTYVFFFMFLATIVLIWNKKLIGKPPSFSCFLLLFFIALLMTLFFVRGDRDSNIALLDKDALSLIRDYAKKLLKENSSVKFLGGDEIPEEIKNMGIRSVFIAKAPLSPDEYVRFDISFFKYVFIGTSVPREINPVMDYELLAEGIWKGQYTEFVKSSKELSSLSGKSILIIWIIFAIFSLIFFHSQYRIKHRLADK